MESKIINKLNELEDYLTNRAEINLDDYQHIIDYTQGIRNDVLNMRKVIIS